MPQVTFAKPFVYRAKRGVRIAYEAGKEYPVTSNCLIAARAVGAVKQVRRAGKVVEADNAGG